MPGRRYINLPPRSGTFRRWRTFLQDSHYGIKILKLQKCKDCHPKQSRDNHTVRAGITCFQCHVEEPIAGMNHQYSSMNPTRRHFYVCSKCHEGANNSYATFVVHAPNPAIAATQESFPMLFYAYWVLVAVAGGTFAVFLPHIFLWGLRDFKTRHKVKDRRRIGEPGCVTPGKAGLGRKTRAKRQTGIRFGSRNKSKAALDLLSDRLQRRSFWVIFAHRRPGQ